MRVSLSDRFLAPSSVSRLLVHALTAAVFSAALLILVAATFPQPLASGLYMVGAPGMAVLAATHYFWRRDAEEPLIAAIGFTAVAGAVDLVLAGFAHGRIELLDPAFGFGLALLLVFGATGLTGEIVPTLGARRST